MEKKQAIMKGKTSAGPPTTLLAQDMKPSWKVVVTLKVQLD
jgi:hypothetical protein